MWAFIMSNNAAQEYDHGEIITAQNKMMLQSPITCLKWFFILLMSLRFIVPSC